VKKKIEQRRPLSGRKEKMRKRKREERKINEDAK